MSIQDNTENGTLEIDQYQSSDVVSVEYSSALYQETTMLKKEIQTFVQELRDKAFSAENEKDILHRDFEEFKKRLSDIENQSHSLITSNLLFKDEVRQEIFNNTKEIAIIKEWITSFEQTINGLKDSVAEIITSNNKIHSELVEHKMKDSGDRLKIIGGIITAAISSIGTLGILIWGIIELLHK